VPTSGSEQTLPEIPGGWTRRVIQLDGGPVHLTLPAAPDEFLDDEDVLSASRLTDYMPYWAYLWPTARRMAELVAKETWTPGTRALEIGSGIGLTGIAGTKAGLEVTFSDYDRQAVDLALWNARQNGLTQARGLRLDWKNPETWKNPLAAGTDRFPVILGSDVIYEPGNHEPVLNVLDRLLSKQGTCWLGDPGRQHSAAFCRLARSRGYAIEIRDSTGSVLSPRDGEFDVRLNEFRLLVLHVLSI